MEITPNCQAARIALAFARERSGEMDTARTIVAPFLARVRGMRLPEDDWVTYSHGQFHEAFDALETLRSAVVRK